MHTLAQEPRTTQQTASARSTGCARARSGQSSGVSSLLHLQRTVGNLAVQRMLEADPEEDRAAGGNGGGLRSVVERHFHTLSAAIRRDGPAVQSDSAGADDREPAIDAKAPAAQAPIASSDRSASDLAEGRTVHFSSLPPIDAPAQWDAIATILSYSPDIGTTPPPAVLTEFGKTNSRIEVNQSSATQNNATFNVELVVDNVIRYWVAGGNRTDIASDNDADITQANYPTVVSDMTPAAAPVNTGGLALLKNQPPRTRFWAEDLTIKHEEFHAADDEKFGREGALEGRDWLNRQTAGSFNDVEVLLGRVSQMVAARILAAMAPPAVEQRAYDDGAADYAARARAIKVKGDARGYAPTPPAPPAPAPAPPAVPKAPAPPAGGRP